MSFEYEKYINEFEQCEPKHVQKIIRKLVKVIVPEDVTDIISRLHSEQDRYIVMKHLQLLRYVGSHEHVLFLKEMLEKTDDDYIIATIVKTIGLIGQEHDIDIVLPYLEKNDMRIIANTIETVGMLGTEDHISLLKKFTDNDENRIRTNALLAIASICDNIRNQVIGKFNAMYNSSNEEFQRSSEYALRELGVTGKLSFGPVSLTNPTGFNRPL